MARLGPGRPWIHAEILRSASEQAPAVLDRAMTDDEPVNRRMAATAAGAAAGDGDIYLARLKLLQKNDPDDMVRTAATESIRLIETAPEPRSSRWPAVGALAAAIIGALLWYFRIKRTPQAKPVHA